MTGTGRPGAHKVLSDLPERVHDEWWHRGVVYQVYPRSFQDSNGDGVGDIRGARERLDYLAWLGIDAVWLSPINRSPMADFGYDVSDYQDVDPLFGSLADLDALIADLHQRGMRLVLDLVPNHTSDQHQWFLDARSSRTAEHRDWYIWRDPLPDGSPPNGWTGFFGGSAWEWDEATGQYYFHSFLKEQPELNWANPRVRAAMFDIMRWWFGRGVDGFRIDVVQLLAKRYELLPTADGLTAAQQRWAAAPAIHSIVRQLRAVADEFDDRVLIGELWMPVRRLVRFYGRDGRGLHLPFNFQLITLPWTAAAIHRAVAAYEGALPEGAWPNWVLGNHDRSRIATRVGLAQARVAAVLLLTLRGTPTMYYGDEIGMTDGFVPAEAQRDPQGLNGGESRDPQRTPMHWDGSVAAGFTSGSPWLPMGPEGATANVEAERDDDESMLTLYRRLLDLRRTEPALSVGDWHDLGRNDRAIAYLRTDGDRRFLVAANLTSSPAQLPEAAREFTGRIVISTTDSHAAGDFQPAAGLLPNEGILVSIDESSNALLSFSGERE